MPTTTITVQEVRPQAPGKKTCTVVDVHGVFYYVWPNHAALYQPGGVYDISYNVRSFKGQGYNYVDNEPRQSSQAPQAPRPQQAAQPRPATGQAGGNYYRETSATDKLSMFVTAIVKAGIQSGQVQFNDEAISLAIQQAIAGYKDGWTTANQNQQPQQQVRQAPPQHNDLNDQIPF